MQNKPMLVATLGTLRSENRSFMYTYLKEMELVTASENKREREEELYSVLQVMEDEVLGDGHSTITVVVFSAIVIEPNGSFTVVRQDHRWL